MQEISVVMEPSVLLIELHYLPCIEFFLQVMQHDTLRLEVCENYQKQSLRNRCYVPAANKVELLTVPVKHSEIKQNIREVQIDYTTAWYHFHWRTIRSAYGKAPFFEYLADDFETVYETKHSLLFDFNQAMLSVCLKHLQICPKIEYTTEYLKVTNVSKQFLTDKRGAIKNYNSPNDDTFPFESYQQVFGREFVPNMSILDLLFCEGPEAKSYLQRQISLRKKLT